MDANYTYDEMLGEPQKILLHYLPSTKEERTLKFNGVRISKIEMCIESLPTPTYFIFQKYLLEIIVLEYVLTDQFY